MAIGQDQEDRTFHGWFQLQIQTELQEQPFPIGKKWRTGDRITAHVNFFQQAQNRCETGLRKGIGNGGRQIV